MTSESWPVNGMKKASTYYFLVLAAANVFVVARVLPVVNRWMSVFFDRLLQGRMLPRPTECVLSHPWWPYVFTVLFLIGAVLSLATRWRSGALCHAVIVLLATEAAVLFFVIIAYALPFCLITEPLAAY